MNFPARLTLTACGLLAAGLLLERGVGSARYGLRLNRTESVPYTLFVSGPLESAPERGDYVCFTHPRSSSPLVKQVFGLPGDRIERMDNRVQVAGRDCGPLQPLDKVHPVEETRVPAGHLFLHASHPESFDSRYAEFGLIPITDIKERVWPLF